MNFASIVAFLGGVGLFLLGMRLMTEGLKVAAGPGLRTLLARGTTTLPRAVGSGFAITALVQSSTASIFATIGFVNAGLLTLPQAIGVIYGANLGTTVTSWLVALIGFKLDLMTIALIAIGIGMAMRVAFGAGRKGALGEALAGFGVFFIGIDVLKEAFSGVGLAFATDPTVAHRVLPYIGIGFVLTLVLQSSSAALVITLSAVASGVLPLPVGAAMVIGANVGTTSTAVFAVIGATPAAKRAAAAHVLFNLVVAVVTAVALPLLLWVIAGFGALVLGHPLAAATALACFHTMSKLVGVAVMWPLTGVLTRWLESLFRADADDIARPHYLDRNVAATPALALDAVAMELDHALELARRTATAAITVPAHGGIDVRRGARDLDGLIEAVGDFAAGIDDIERADLIAQALRVNQYLADVAEHSVEFVEHGALAGGIADPELAAALHEINTRAHAALSGGGDHGAGLADFEARYQAVKGQLLRAGAEGRLPVRRMVAALDQISALRRLVDQFTKAAIVFGLFRASLAPAAA